MNNCFNVHFETVCRNSALADFLDMLLNNTTLNDFYVKVPEKDSFNYIIEFESGGMPDVVCEWMDVHAIPDTINIINTLGGIERQSEVIDN